MKTVGIITPNFGRPAILSIWCAAVNRLRSETLTFIPAVVVSGPEDKSICDKYNIRHIEHENLPVSAKLNRGMEYMRSIGIDYVMISGSDNIWSTDTWRRFQSGISSGYDLLGVNQIYFYGTSGSYRGECVLLKTKYMLGVMKTISSTVLDEINWKPWTKDKNHGLDGLASAAIKPFVKTQKVIENAEVFDIKSKVNINRFEFWRTKLLKDRQDPTKILSIMGEEEQLIFKQIMGWR